MAKSPQLEKVIQMVQELRSKLVATISEARAAFDQMATQLEPPAGVTREPVDAGGVSAEWVSAPGAADNGVLIYLHGGAYAVGSVEAYLGLISRLSQAAGTKALGVDYRLAPEHLFPAAVEDAVTAYRWLLSNGADPARIAIAGDSAGGGLVMALLLSLRDAGDPLPAAGVCLSPWVDLECSGESMVTKAPLDPFIQKGRIQARAELYLGGHEARTPLASPLYADLSGLPPLFIHVGSSETLLDDATRLAARAREAGVSVTLEVWDDMTHVWQLFAAILPEGQQSIDGIGAFIRQRLAAPRSPAGG